MKVKISVYKSRYSMSKNGLWPFSVWTFKFKNVYGGKHTYGIAFHWLKIADAKITMEF